MTDDLQHRLTACRKNTKRLNWLLLGLIGMTELLILLLIIYISMKLSRDMAHIYNVVAIDMVLIWLGILVGYYTWSVYFHNINLGLTNEDWAEIRLKKARGEKVDERMHNPNHEHTLGLPEGTVRGTLALSLAVGALAMLVASLGRQSTWPPNEVFIDAFDFFKTAFLMMIAFYFGNKSLESLKGSRVLPMHNEARSAVQEAKPVMPPPAQPGEVNKLRERLNDEPRDGGDVANEEGDFHNADAKA
jgi:hypothetical protein